MNVVTFFAIEFCYSEMHLYLKIIIIALSFLTLSLLLLSSSLPCGSFLSILLFVFRSPEWSVPVHLSVQLLLPRVHFYIVFYSFLFFSTSLFLIPRSTC